MRRRLEHAAAERAVAGPLSKTHDHGIDVPEGLDEALGTGMDLASSGAPNACLT